MRRSWAIVVLVLWPLAAGARGWTASLDAWLEMFLQLDPARWHCSDGWINGAPFAVGWRADHARVSEGKLELVVDDAQCPNGCNDMPYAGGECKTPEVYGYGWYTVRMKAAAGDGLVTGFFLYTGPHERPPSAHYEIDVEILGRDTGTLYVNSFVDGVPTGTVPIALGFDAAAGYHHYTIAWMPDRIEWYVDGARVYTSHVPVPAAPMHVFANLWAAEAGDAFYGDFRSGTESRAYFDTILYLK